MPKESPLANHTIGELKIGEKSGAMVLAIRTPEGRFDTTPSAQDEIHPMIPSSSSAPANRSAASKPSCATKCERVKTPKPHLSLVYYTLCNSIETF